MEIKIRNGDYVPDGLGGVERCGGDEALLQRVLYRLTAHRGQFPPLPELGSRLYQRLSAARLYVAEALAEEAVSIKDVALAPAGEGRSEVTVQLSCRGEELAVTVMV